jgi:hypothetical protein
MATKTYQELEDIVKGVLRALRGGLSEEEFRRKVEAVFMELEQGDWERLNEVGRDVLRLLERGVRKLRRLKAGTAAHTSVRSAILEEMGMSEMGL